MMSDGDIPEPSDAEEIRWRALESDVAAMGELLRSGSATSEDVDGAFARLMSTDVDGKRYRNVLHVPADAGEHAAAIEAILRRIPDGWGRWLSVDAGWYPLVIATDALLAGLDPGYVVHQVKEKFGTLRYYSWPSSEDVARETLGAMDAVIAGAERASAVTCERCGATGFLHQAVRGWMKTLCASCAVTLGYVPAQPT
ncbi:hypothetical protein SAMN02799620_05365 [Mycolicibacterium fluoranthenivorans]|uniref:Uncharacterized protein n=2 Tax=Mycolicibacterium fluoranthenivorans TaxID=258505 RepID=A0A1G4WX87_9MYCO|nr:hypothetical protein SAMN02799620_05365 [Mycolicibacterium fluoranthenivorans]